MGAEAKIDDLEHRYPHLLSPIFQKAVQTISVSETLASMTTSDVSIHSSTSTSRSSSTKINTALDFAAILKASQSLSSTIQINELLHQLTHIILPNSGGDRCALILPDSDHNWYLRAIATTEITEICAEPLEGNHFKKFLMVSFNFLGIAFRV